MWFATVEKVRIKMHEFQNTLAEIARTNSMYISRNNKVMELLKYENLLRRDEVNDAWALADKISDVVGVPKVNKA